MREKRKKRTFSRQIRIFYIHLFLIVFLLCGGLYLFSSYRLSETSENNALNHQIQVVENNMESLIQNVNDSSKLIAYSDNVQSILQMDGSAGYEERVKLQDSIIQMAACCEGVSSVYLFDQTGESYLAGNIYEVEEIRTWLNDTSKYQDALNQQKTGKKGTAIFSYQTYLDPERQIISFIRPVRNLDTLEDMGTLVMNIPVSELTKTFYSGTEQGNMEVAILDNSGQIISASEKGGWLAELAGKQTLAGDPHSYQEQRWEGEDYRVGKLEQEDGRWTIVGAVPQGETLESIRQYTILSVMIIFLGMAVCVWGTSFQTRKILQPVQNILSSMEQVPEGRLERIPVLRTNREIDDLQQHYNKMLDETEKLMSQKVEEQRMRRKYELSLLQEQIKPHFLYNTFDSVCALAMMGQTKDVYTMMQALGQYYRNSLHKGQEIITVKEEISIVKNYLIIQSYRYDDVFRAEYEVDKEVEQCRMIKLILQPLVENAIYHGFREHELTGTITIRAINDGDFVKLQVEDDGIGIEKERLEQILGKGEENQGKRFGLRGTLKRVQLYYQRDDLVDIRSEVGKGTVITVRIPKEKGEINAESTDH